MEFIIKGNLIISDPCYKRGTRCAIYNRRAKKGLWKAHITKSDYYIASLFVHHAQHNIDINDDRFKLISKNIGVDSGQCGIYSDEIYPYDSTGDYFDKNTFYGKVCHITEERDWGIINEGGVVSESGAGDGSYPLYGIYHNRYLIGVKLVYIQV